MEVSVMRKLTFHSVFEPSANGSYGEFWLEPHTTQGTGKGVSYHQLSDVIDNESAYI